MRCTSQLFLTDGSDSFIERLMRRAGNDGMKGPSFWMLIALCTTAIIGVDSLHNMKLVFPPVVRVGGEATLLCLYDLEGEPLYSVKWYRGNHEFYRYMPKESPPGRVFHFEGIMVDISASNANQVSLKNIPLHLSGKFRCEVSADAPLFTTKCIEDELTVLEFPDSRPVMIVMNTSYREGDLLTVNCTTQPSKSPQTLTFYINNHALSQNVVTAWEGGAMLETRLRRSDFSPRGELRLKCVASVMGLYNISSGSVAIWLEQGRLSALGAEDVTNTGSKNSQESFLMLLGMVLWLYSVHCVQFMDA